MLLSEIADRYDDTPPEGFMLDRPAVELCIKRAVRLYCGYAKLTDPAFAADEIHDVVDASGEIGDSTADFDINPSENAIIEPLYTLYIEEQNAIMLEASRGLGVDPFGRSVSEIQGQILQRELDLPKAAFIEPVVSV